MSDRTCSVATCERPRGTRGWCSKHYQMWRAHGDPLGGTRIRYDNETRFWSYVYGPEPLGCWEWTGALTRGGYGRVVWKGSTALAHRVAYELLRAEIPETLQIDHLCRNTKCVNPWHLEPVTALENIHRSPRYSGEENCHHGHPWAENTRITDRGTRSCIACVNDYTEKRKASRREATRLRKVALMTPLQVAEYDRQLAIKKAKRLETARRRANSKPRRTVCSWGHQLIAPNLCTQEYGRKCLACSRARARKQYAARLGKTFDFKKTSDAYYREIMADAA